MSNHEFTKTHFIDLHQDIAQTPQDHISIDLLRSYNITSQGNYYTLTAICSLTGYLMITPIKDKKTMTVVTHLFFAYYVKIWFSQNTTFWQWDGI